MTIFHQNIQNLKSRTEHLERIYELQQDIVIILLNTT